MGAGCGVGDGPGALHWHVLPRHLAKAVPALALEPGQQNDCPPHQIQGFCVVGRVPAEVGVHAELGAGVGLGGAGVGVVGIPELDSDRGYLPADPLLRAHPVLLKVKA